MRISTSSAAMDATSLADVWPILTPEERMEGFNLLGRGDAEPFFRTIGPREQVQILEQLHPAERRSWMRLLAPDDAADPLPEAPPALRTPRCWLRASPARRRT